MRYYHYSDEQREYLISIIPGRHHSEVAELYNSKYPNAPITAKQSMAFAQRHKVKTGFRASEGMPPHNKGKKQTDYMSDEAIARTEVTRFKKGNHNANCKSIGEVSYRKSRKFNYAVVKVAKGKWMNRSHKVWEDHFGKLPDNQMIIHINGDSYDDRIENLALIKRDELMLYNHSQLGNTDNYDINKCAINVVKLQAMITKISNNKERGLE